MGYWSTDADGRPFVDGSELVWGDSPADVFGEEVPRLIEAYERSSGHQPESSDIRQAFAYMLDPDGFNHPPAYVNAEMTDIIDAALVEAGKYFEEDMGRRCTATEFRAGLEFALAGLYEDDAL